MRKGLIAATQRNELKNEFALVKTQQQKTQHPNGKTKVIEATVKKNRRS
jgi:hypothetical protein